MNKKEVEAIESALNTTKELMEIVLDSAIQQPELVEKIPVVNLVKAGYDITQAIKDNSRRKKFRLFLDGFNVVRLGEENVMKFKQRYYEDPDFKEDFDEFVLEQIESHERGIKNKVLGCLVASYVNENINYQTLQSLSYCLSRLHPEGIQHLHNLSKHDFYIQGGANELPDEETFLIGAGIGYRNGTKFTVTAKGMLLYNTGIAPLF